MTLHGNFVVNYVFRWYVLGLLGSRERYAYTISDAAEM